MFDMMTCVHSVGITNVTGTKGGVCNMCMTAYVLSRNSVMWHVEHRAPPARLRGSSAAPGHITFSHGRDTTVTLHEQ